MGGLALHYETMRDESGEGKTLTAAMLYLNARVRCSCRQSMTTWQTVTRRKWVSYILS